MTLITEFVEGQQPHEVLQGRVGYASEILDFSANSQLSGDVVQALKIKAGTMVHSVGRRVIVPEGGAATTDIGDGDADDGYGAAEDANAAINNVVRALEADTYGLGKFYAEDDTIDLTLNADLATAKIEVFAYYSTPKLSSN